MKAALSKPFARQKFKTLDGKKTIELITPAEFHSLKDGTELVSIDGRTAIVGKHVIDQDTRYGFIAFGFEVKK